MFSQTCAQVCESHASEVKPRETTGRGGGCHCIDRLRINGHGEVAKSIQKSLDDYFRKLDGATATGIYDMVICNVEKTMLETVMHHAKGNQTHAAEMLGLTRASLYRRMEKYGL